jgi:large subunit ribosomal protein L31e
LADDQLERVYTVPIRKQTIRVPRRQRAKRAVKTVREFVARHMKADPDAVWIDSPVNEALWARGIEKPPARLRIRAIKFEDGVVGVSRPEE